MSQVKYFFEDLTAHLKNIGASEIISDPDWINFESALQRQIKYSNFYKKPSAIDTSLIGKFSRRISGFISNDSNAATNAATNAAAVTSAVSTITLTAIGGRPHYQLMQQDGKNQKDYL